MAYWAQKTVVMFQTVLFLKCTLLLFSLFSGCTNQSEHSLPYYNDADFTPLFLSNSTTIETTISHKIAPFSFKNQHNNTVSEKDIDGKIHVANFIFTSCGSICPTMTKHMQVLSHNYQKSNDVVLLSYSVTPWIDSVKTLKTYTENHGIDDPNWHFLTGNKSKIYQLARQSYFAEESIGFSKDSTEFLHTEHFILVDKHKRIRGIYNGTLALEIKQLIADIAQLQTSS